MAKKKISGACALPGPLSSRSRDRLPDEAFGLPRERKYPMYRLSAGRLVPDASHAGNAKARARQQYEKGALTMAQLVRIEQKANKVLRHCKALARKCARPNPHKGACAQARSRGHRATLSRALRRDR